MDKDEWGDPEIFRPERFLDESGIQVVGRDRIMPFSIGLLQQFDCVTFISVEDYHANNYYCLVDILDKIM